MRRWLTWVLAVAWLMKSSSASSRVRESPGHANEHFAFAIGQLIQTGIFDLADWAANEVFDQPTGDARGEERIASRHDPHRGQQVNREGVLQEESRCTPLAMLRGHMNRDQRS